MVGEPYDFIHIIKRGREHCGMSLSEAAKLIGISKAHLWDLETGKSRNPTIVVLAGLACAYGIDLNILAHLAAASAPGADYRKAVVSKRTADLRLASARTELERS